MGAEAVKRACEQASQLRVPANGAEEARDPRSPLPPCVGADRETGNSPSSVLS